MMHINYCYIEWFRNLSTTMILLPQYNEIDVKYSYVESIIKNFTVRHQTWRSII